MGKRSEPFVFHRSHTQPDVITRITLHGRDVQFFQDDDSLVRIHLKEHRLKRFGFSDIPLGTWIHVLAKEGHDRGIEIFSLVDRKQYLEFTGRIVVDAAWEFNVTPRLCAEAFVGAIKHRQETLGDVSVASVEFIERDEAVPDHWVLTWDVHIDSRDKIEDVMLAANQVNKEIRELHWQMILKHAPHLGSSCAADRVGIFLSHSRRDRGFARKFASDLRAHGVYVWVDEAEILPGDSLIEKLEQGIDEMNYLCVVLSPHSVASEWVKREVQIALTDEIHGKRVKVLPLLYKKCALPGFLRTMTYADCTTRRRYKEAVDKIVCRIRTEHPLGKGGGDLWDSTIRSMLLRRV
jgi:hypothetical protein